METGRLSDQVRGKTIRLSWTDGPTKGTTQEHVFHKNGTVEWHSIGNGAGSAGKAKSGSGSANAKAEKPPEKPPYTAEKITDDVCLVSYLSESGYTLTVTLNFADDSTVAIASNGETWAPVHGSFEVVD
jgi:hypothetical protein